jgi:hypothetical protein
VRNYESDSRRPAIMEIRSGFTRASGLADADLQELIDEYFRDTWKDLLLEVSSFEDFMDCFQEPLPEEMAAKPEFPSAKQTLFWVFDIFKVSFF